MKYSLIFMFCLFFGFGVFGEQFPSGSVEEVEISWMEGATSVIQNNKDSLIYVVSAKQGAAGENAILVLNSNLEIVKKIDSTAVGFAIENICHADYDLAGNMWFGANGGTLYFLEKDTLKKKIFSGGEFERIGVVKCFSDKVYLATNWGLYSYNPVSDLLTEEAEKEKAVAGVAIDSNTVWAAGERISRYEYFITYGETDWIVQSSNDSLLKPLFEYDAGGITEHKTIRFVLSFKEQVFIGGIQNLLIKHIGNGQWEDCCKDFPDNIFFTQYVTFDSAGNIWTSNGQGIFKFSISEKKLTKYGYMENNLPQSMGPLAASPFDGKIMYFVTRKKVIKHNSDQTGVISSNKVKIIKPTVLSSGCRALYNLHGQKVISSPLRINNQGTKLPPGIYIRKGNGKNKLIFVK